MNHAKFQSSLDFETDEVKASNTTVKVSSSSITNTSEAVIQISSHNDKERLRAYLSMNSSINVLEIIDSRQYTLCHIACINNNMEMLEIFIDYINANFFHLKHKISEWVNKKNLEGYTPLHMSAFKGNIKLIEYLEKLGADITAKNKHGIYMLKLIIFYL